MGQTRLPWHALGQDSMHILQAPVSAGEHDDMD